jgi:cell division cycle protein 20 (cofactor of APC complex)
VYLPVLLPSDLVDDYYLNLLSWSRGNVLSVALGQSVYLWNAVTGAIDHLLTLDGRDDYVTSVSWMDLVRAHTKDKRGWGRGGDVHFPCGATPAQTVS